MLSNFNQNKYRLFKYNRLFKYRTNSIILINQMQDSTSINHKRITYSNTNIRFTPPISLNIPFSAKSSIYKKLNILENLTDVADIEVSLLTECTSEEYLILTEGILHYCKHMIDIPIKIKELSNIELINMINNKIQDLKL